MQRHSERSEVPSQHPHFRQDSSLCVSSDRRGAQNDRPCQAFPPRPWPLAAGPPPVRCFGCRNLDPYLIYQMERAMPFRKMSRWSDSLSASPWPPGAGLTEPACGTAPQPRFSPTAVEGKTWLSFPAAGFSQPACGVVYRMKDEVSCGMPLGGIDTGCIDLETSGLLGFCTIFNTHVPRRGPINLPILGLSVGGKTWVLCDKQPKQAWREKGVPYGKPVLPVLSDLKLEGVETAKQIHYWGHYPVADLEFEADAPVQVGLRAWSPFLPGDLEASMMPAAVFEVHLRNPGKTPQYRHDCLFLPRSRSEGGGNESICATDVRRPRRGR